MRVVVVGASGNVGTSVLAALESEPSVTSIVGVGRAGQGHRAGDVRQVAGADEVGAADHPGRGAERLHHLVKKVLGPRDRTRSVVETQNHRRGHRRGTIQMGLL